MNNLKFSQLICSRLCHDLISPVGAINSGFEVLEECEPQDQKELLDLIKRSARIASQRLIFYRSAFGYSEVVTADCLNLLKKIITNYLEILKINFLWLLKESNEIPQTIENLFPIWSKLMMNIILLGSEGMPQGGDIKISNVSNIFWDLNFDFRGKIATVRTEILNSLNEKENLENMTPSTIHVLLIRDLADQLNLKIKIKIIHAQHWQLELKS